MTLATTAGDAFVLTTVFAVAARIAGALTWDGAAAGFAVGLCVSAGFGLPGLAVLGTFFVVGSIATRVGWAKKKARGTAEAGEGRRDWKRVLGKGGVAAAAGLFSALSDSPHWSAMAQAFAGSVAAALADTLGTEIGTLGSGSPRLLPTFARAPVGTPGAVSIAGTLAAGVGSVLVAWIAAAAGMAHPEDFRVPVLGIAAGGFVACLLESVAVTLGFRAPGFVRNVLTTFLGAALAWEFSGSYVV